MSHNIIDGLSLPVKNETWYIVYGYDSDANCSYPAVETYEEALNQIEVFKKYGDSWYDNRKYENYCVIKLEYVTYCTQSVVKESVDESN